jgi:hypothetical protein
MSNWTFVPHSSQSTFRATHHGAEECPARVPRSISQEVRISELGQRRGLTCLCRNKDSLCEADALRRAKYVSPKLADYSFNSLYLLRKREEREEQHRIQAQVVIRREQLVKMQPRVPRPVASAAIRVWDPEELETTDDESEEDAPISARRFYERTPPPHPAPHDLD